MQSISLSMEPLPGASQKKSLCQVIKTCSNHQVSKKVFMPVMEPLHTKFLFKPPNIQLQIPAASQPNSKNSHLYIVWGELDVVNLITLFHKQRDCKFMQLQPLVHRLQWRNLTVTLGYTFRLRLQRHLEFPKKIEIMGI